MFVGRTFELELLNNNLSSVSTATLVYGKRRIGKTTLIKEALKTSKDKYIYYECIKSTLKDNIDLLTNELKKANILLFDAKFDSLISLFEYINSLNYKVNIVIDEYPYLKVMEKNEYIDSVFQKIIDSYLSNINLIISGSHIGMMKDLDKYGNALFGRFKTKIVLEEFNYLEASLFYPSLSNYDKVAFYSVFGGSPFVLEKIDEKKSLKDNIINLLLNKDSIIYSYASMVLTSDISFIEQSRRIFAILRNTRMKYSDIQTKLSIEANGLLSKQLKVLTDMSFIRKNHPINKRRDDKKVTYDINDNLLRFYYTYLYTNNSSLEMIKPEIFYNHYIDKSIITFIAHRFEDIVKEYFKITCKYKNNDVLDIGTYYYDDSINKKNGEFDCALELIDGYALCEVKYLENKMTKQMVDKEIEQIKDIKELKIIDINFASINGYDFDNDYIDGNDIYFKK